jgi:hypothetical protein
MAHLLGMEAQGGVAMKRRRLPLAIGSALLGFAILPGCETLKHLGQRRDSQTQTQPDEDVEKEKNRPEGLRNFFKPTRLPGAMSSEGAEVERDLGVR